MTSTGQLFSSAVIALTIVAVSPVRTTATVLYVDSANGSDANPGTLRQPLKSIYRANARVKPGDTVYIRAGTYNVGISPAASGTERQPITYRNYENDTVTISGTSHGIWLDGKSYIVVDGFTFADVDGVFWLQNGANHNTLSHLTARSLNPVGLWSAAKIFRNSSYNWVHHCEISGKAQTNGAGGSILDIGNESDAGDASDYNLIEDNTFYHAGHHVLGVSGRYNIVRNNYLRNEAWRNGFGERILYLNGYFTTSGRNLIEGNRIGYAGPPYESYGRPGMSLDTSYNIVRFNTFYHNDLSGLNVYNYDYFDQAPTYNVIYHNTFFHNGINSKPNTPAHYKAALSFVNDKSFLITNNEVKNNLFYSHSAPYGFLGALAENQVFANNWDGDRQGDPRFVNASVVPGDPRDGKTPDLHLQVTSPCIDAGGALTTVTSASGSGTSFQVANANYFVDGWGIAQGDSIQFLGTSQRATITSVDYAGNMITVDRSLTWTQHQGLSLAYRGNAPDVGAHESMFPAPPKNLRIIKKPP